MRTLSRVVTGLVLAVALCVPAAAVPIPWKNCGKSTDLLSIAKSDASVWPPQAAAPASAEATFDTAGNLRNLRLFLVHGLAWTFNSGPLPTTTSAGFVSLPASFPMTLASPPQPIPAGPYSTIHTFGAHTPTPTTVASQGTLGTAVDAPLAIAVSLSANGTPGFPLAPAAGDVYGLHVQMSESGGAAVFCMDINVPFKTAVPFVAVQQASNIPALSPIALATLALILAGTGLFAGTTRSAPRRR